jgi:hypothetical protein
MSTFIWVFAVVSMACVDKRLDSLWLSTRLKLLA